VSQDDVVRGILAIESHAVNARFLRLSLSLDAHPAGGAAVERRSKIFDML
jgi:hypothetical protein